MRLSDGSDACYASAEPHPVLAHQRHTHNCADAGEHGVMKPIS